MHNCVQPVVFFACAIIRHAPPRRKADDLFILQVGFAEKLDGIISEAEQVATELYGESQSPQDQQARTMSEAETPRESRIDTIPLLRDGVVMPLSPREPRPFISCRAILGALYKVLEVTLRIERDVENMVPHVDHLQGHFSTLFCELAIVGCRREVTRRVRAVQEMIGVVIS